MTLAGGALTPFTLLVKRKSKVLFYIIEESRAASAFYVLMADALAQHHQELHGARPRKSGSRNKPSSALQREARLPRSSRLCMVSTSKGGSAPYIREDVPVILGLPEQVVTWNECPLV